MIESEKLNYKRVYELLKRVSDGYERGLNKANGQIHDYKNQIEEMQRELLENKEMIKRLKALETKNRKSPFSKDEIDAQLQAVLDTDLPHSRRRKNSVNKASKKSPLSKSANR